MEEADGSSGTSADVGAPADPFEAMLERAIVGLPATFREQLGSVAIVIEDWPSGDQLAAVGADGLYGLYQGVPRTAFGAELAMVASKITIFRGPLEQHFRDPQALEAAIEDTLHHEVAHHLGISDARLQEIRQQTRQEMGR
jgi:predicted Zn-dependent protease with MMP-like domain